MLAILVRAIAFAEIPVLKMVALQEPGGVAGRLPRSRWCKRTAVYDCSCSCVDGYASGMFGYKYITVSATIRCAVRAQVLYDGGYCGGYNGQHRHAPLRSTRFMTLLALYGLEGQRVQSVMKRTTFPTGICTQRKKNSQCYTQHAWL